MPHAAAAVIAGLVQANVGLPLREIPLSEADTVQLRAALLDDGRGLYFSALATYLNALVSLNAGSFSWATVKLYYSCFYAARSILCSSDLAIYYHGSKPHSLYCRSGSCLKKEKGVTHKIVWTLFQRHFPNNPMLNVIDLESAPSWLTGLREAANYKNAKFPDPLVPPHFAQVDGLGLNTALSAYVNDDSFLYTFDPEHAALAYPLECLRRAKRAAVSSGDFLDSNDLRHLDGLRTSCGIGLDINAELV